MRYLSFIILSVCMIFLSPSQGHSMLEEREKPSVRISSLSPETSSPKYLLIVEDNTVVRMVACRAARNSGLEPIEAVSFAEAVIKYKELFESEEPKDVVGIISDYNLNEGKKNPSEYMTGLTFVNYVRHDKGNTHTPIIIYSGTDERDFPQRCLAQGATNVFKKGDTYPYPKILEYLLSLSTSSPLTQ